MWWSWSSRWWRWCWRWWCWWWWCWRPPAAWAPSGRPWWDLQCPGTGLLLPPVHCLGHSVGDYWLTVTSKKERCQTPTLRRWWCEWLIMMIMMKMILIARMTNNGHLEEDGNATGEHCDEVYQQKGPWERKSSMSRPLDNYSNYKRWSQ